MKKKSASLWILILLIISSLTAPAEAARKVREDHLVYVKDRELWITNGKHEPVKLTKGLYNEYLGITFDIGPLLSYGKEGRMLLIPENAGFLSSEIKYIYNLFYVDLMDNTYPKKKIDENVLCHEADDKNQVIYYEKLRGEVIDGKYIQKVEIYRFDFNRKEKVAEGKIQVVSNDGETLLFIDNNTLYKKTVGQEAIKIVDDFPPGSMFYNIIKFDRSLDTVYYTLKNESLYKKVKNNPAEKVLENVGLYSLGENILDKDSYRNGTFYYFKKNPGEVETKKTYGDFAVDDITPQIYEQMDESSREKVDWLRRMMNFEIDHFFTDRKLYFYDGKKSHLVEEGELIHSIGNYLIDPSHHQGRLSVYPMLNRDSFPKVRLSEVLEREKKDWERGRARRGKEFFYEEEETWQRTNSAGDILRGMVKERLTQQHIFEDGKHIGVLKGGGVDLRFSKTPGELLFFGNLINPDDLPRGDFYSARLEDNKLVSPKFIREDLSINSINIRLYETSLMQTRSMYMDGFATGNRRGVFFNLYADGKGILSVYERYIKYNPSMDMVIFYPKSLVDKLEIYHNKKVTEIPKVDCRWGRITFFNDSFIAFRKYMEESSHSFGLVLFDGQKERIVAGGVDEFIVAGPSNYVEGNDRPWIPRW